MPGLLRGVARTAVVAGKATAVSNRVSAGRPSAGSNRVLPLQPAQAHPPGAGAAVRAAAAPPQPDLIQQLKDLAALRDQGVLTDEELAAQKARVLGGCAPSAGPVRWTARWPLEQTTPVDEARLITHLG